jgi:ABC-2 type transport system ATP-binding protein
MIEVRELCKRYGSTVAVDGLSFDVRPGHVTGFLGPNGAGKSTTMRLILGLDRPTGGTTLVDGKPYARHRDPMRVMGALLEAKSTHPGRTAFDHLLCVANAAGIPRRRVGEVLELVGLSGVARKKTHGFSLGMAQRLGLAQALLGDPPVLMLNEPVNGLGPEGIRWVREFLKDQAGRGRAVFVSSHLMSEMAQMAEHLVIVGQGRLIADTSVSEFVAGSVGSHVRVRSPQAGELTRRGATVEPGQEGSLQVTGLACAAIGDIAAEHGLRIHELYGHTVSLEEAFMERTGQAVEYRTPAEVA